MYTARWCVRFWGEGWNCLGLKGGIQSRPMGTTANIKSGSNMRVLVTSFFTGLAAIALLTGLLYFFNPRGDSHLGCWIYIFISSALLGCHVLGMVTMLGVLRWRRSACHRPVTLPLTFLLVLASYVLAFLFIVRLAFGFWVWDAEIALFIPCLIVATPSAGVFVFRLRTRAA